MKTLTIIDAFIDNNSQKTLLNNFLSDIKLVDPILLITNSILDEMVIKNVDYLFYDKNNVLFRHDYDNYEKFYLWQIINNFKLTTCHTHKQKHGLPVLINLFRSLKLAKELGYTHFRRVEYDSLLGKNTLLDFKNTPIECFNNNKKAKFYINQNNKAHSFQYFFSEIDFFLSNFPEIKNEDDYINLLKREFNNLDFVTVEKLMYYYINKLDKNNIYIKDDLADELNDTIWNQSTSNSHLPSYMHECLTDLYKQNDKLFIFSLNKTNKQLNRKIKIYHNNNFDTFDHNFNSNGEWMLNEINSNANKIEIYDNDNLVFKNTFTKVENYIENI